jgi:subtilase family serine protease
MFTVRLDEVNHAICLVADLNNDVLESNEDNSAVCTSVEVSLMAPVISFRPNSSAKL